MHNIHLYNTLVGEAECWTYTDGAVMHRADYIGIVGSWFQAAAGLRVIANLDNGLGKEDHRPVVVIMTCQHIAAPRVESGQ
eukprot:7773305-Pyramimonas_sp.AAC.1